MNLFDGQQQLWRLLQKLWRYQHYQKNYKNRLVTGVITKRQKIKNLRAFQPRSGYLFRNWEEILLDADKNLVLTIAAWVIKSYC